MLKNCAYILFGLLLALIVYLFFAHWLIYFRIGRAHLPATDNRHSYLFNQEQTTWPKTVYAALGDSLTAGVGATSYEQAYPYLVAEKIAATKQQVNHLNFSYPGARSIDLLRDQITKVIGEQPTVVTLLIGTNDVHGGVSDQQFRANYELLVRLLKTQTRAQINLVTIPEIGSQDLLWPPYDYYYHGKIRRFNKIIKELALAYGVHYVDLASVTAASLPKPAGYYAADSFHLANSGYQFWANFIYDHLDQ